MRGYVYIHINYMRLMDEKTKEKKEKQNLHCKCGENKERKKAKDGSSLSLFMRMKKILQLLATVHMYIHISVTSQTPKKSFHVWIMLLQQKSASTYSSSSLSCPMHPLFALPFLRFRYG